MKITLYSLIFFILSVFNFADEIYEFNKEVILNGTLTTELFYGAPGYGENIKTDKKVYPYIIVLNKEIDVKKSSASDEFSEDEINVKKIQITFDKELTNKIKNLKGKKIVATGVLFHSDNGNHYTNVLIDIKKIEEFSN